MYPTTNHKQQNFASNDWSKRWFDSQSSCILFWNFSH